mgnify:CR=1 FL=1
MWERQLCKNDGCGKNGLVTDLRGYIGRRAITFRALTPSP